MENYNFTNGVVYKEHVKQQTQKFNVEFGDMKLAGDLIKDTEVGEDFDKSVYSVRIKLINDLPIMNYTNEIEQMSSCLLEWFMEKTQLNAINSLN